MAANNNKKDDNMGFNVNVIKNICSKYKKYIATGAMLILLSVVISTSRAASNGTSKPDEGPAKTVSTDDEQKEKAEVDAHEEVNALLEEYYQCYVSGDTDKLEKIAYPISDTEKSYVQLLSKYVEKYDNIKCYTKKGISDGEYVVMAASEMKFKDIETGAPDLACFYVRKNENGEVYIDNAYSQFNQTNNVEVENKDEAISALISEFIEQDEDMVALQRDIRSEYDKALEKDEQLQVMVTSTFQNAIADWVASFGPVEGENEGDKKEEKPGSESSGQTETRTAYAKTRVNMREKRSTSSDIIQTLEAGTEVTIYGTSKDGWFKVKSKGKTGFVSKEYIVSDKSKVEKEDDTDTSAKTRTAYAKTKVNMREKRSTDSDIITTLKAGTKVTIYGTSKDGWFKVKSKGRTGYVSKEYIVSDKSKVEKEDDTDTSSKTRTAYAKTKVNLREKRSTDSEIITTLKAGTAVTIYGTSKDGWFKVKYKGKTGFISKEYIVSDKSKVEKEDTQTGGSSSSNKRTAYAKTGVNMRKSRSTDSDVVQTLKAGTKVMIYGTSKNGWFKVRSKGKSGYVKKEYIVSDKSKVEKEDTPQENLPAAPSYYNEGDTITLSDSVNVRSSMSETSDRVGLAYKGDVITVIMSYAEGWTKVSWNGQTGYVKTAYLR